MWNPGLLDGNTPIEELRKHDLVEIHPDPNYKPDIDELSKAIERSRKLRMEAEEYLSKLDEKSNH